MSIKSFTSVPEEAQVSASPGLAAVAGSSPSAAQTNQLDRSNASPHTLSFPETLSDQESELEPQEFEQVPEAHPFDLNFENLAGPHATGPSEEAKKGKLLSTAPKLLNKIKKPSSSPCLASSPGCSDNQLEQQPGREPPSQMRCVLQKVYLTGLFLLCTSCMPAAILPYIDPFKVNLFSFFNFPTSIKLNNIREITINYVLGKSFAFPFLICVFKKKNFFLEY